MTEKWLTTEAINVLRISGRYTVIKIDGPVKGECWIIETNTEINNTRCSPKLTHKKF
jgi:hypothetical protein